MTSSGRESNETRAARRLENETCSFPGDLRQGVGMMES